ncbi:MAG: hypothetical protein WD877_00735 [Candidatus Saccharimonadales bacterium]
MAEVTRTRETVTEDRPVVANDHGRNVADRIIWFIAGIILILLALRFLLSLLGANRENAFADFIYDASQPFVSPFFGLFNYNVVDYGVSRLEFYTLFAMLMYAVIAWGLSSLINLNRR